MPKKQRKTDDLEKKTNNAVVYWLNEIDAAKKREKDYRKDGQRILDIYSGKDPEITPFNVLFSNTETLLPALYSSIPRPIVNRRFKDDDPLGKEAATAGQRVLEFLVDTNVEGYETFDEAMRMATLDALLPGRGITCVKYDASIGQLPTESVDEEVPAAEDASAAGATDQVGNVAEPAEYKASELVCTETRSWDRVYFGYAKKWSKVPWVAFEEYIDREEATRLFGEDIASKIVYTEIEEKKETDDDTDSNMRGSADDRNQGERKTALIYQIWDKDGGKKIRYVCSQMKEQFLKVEDDPLGLTGFFNMPKPMHFIEKSNDLTPVAMYTIYENQAKEINRLTIRINRLVEAIKARGAYDGELGDDLAQIMEGDDNTLIAAEKGASISAEKGFQNAIWFMPIENLVATLMQLYQAREQAKRVIYEITGISDIIRGSSVASETATAQNIKSQWGTMRLKRLQKEVQRYSRDLLRMMLEVAATKFDEETWAKMTGLPFLTGEQRAQLDMVVTAAKQQAQQMQMTGQKPTPEQMQQVQQIQAELQKPVWPQVLEMLRNDTQRAYRIDIETNSTIEPEAVEDQKNISELMNALAQYLNGVGPLVAKGVLPFEAAQSMLLAITRRFRFGTDIEDYIKQMKAPPPEGAEDAEAKKAEAQAAQQERQFKLAELDRKDKAEQRKQAMEAEREAREHQMAMEKIAREEARDAQEHEFKMEELRSKHIVGMEAGALKLATIRAQKEAAAAKPSQARPN